MAGTGAPRAIVPRFARACDSGETRNRAVGPHRAGKTRGGVDVPERRGVGPHRTLGRLSHACQAKGPCVAQGRVDGSRVLAVEPRRTSRARGGGELTGVLARGTRGLVGRPCDGEVALVRTHLDGAGGASRTVVPCRAQPCLSGEALGGTVVTGSAGEAARRARLTGKGQG